MRIAYLTLAYSMHINIKLKYFDENDEIVFLAMMNNDLHDRAALKIRDNTEVYYFQHYYDLPSQIKTAGEIKTIITKKRIDILHIIDMAYAIYALLLKSFGTKIVLENNGSDVLLPKNKETRILYRVAYKVADAVVQDSFASQKAGIRLGASKKNNKVIELGIDTNIFNPNIKKGIFKRKYGIPANAKVILSPRRFTSLYNIVSIISIMKDVWNRYPETWFVFCTYTQNIRYKYLIDKESRGERVLYLGYMDNENEMPYVYRDSDVIISIPKSDSSPRSVYESIATGGNVIASDLPWIDGKFERNRDLFVIDSDNKERLVNLILGIMNEEYILDKSHAYKSICKNLDYHLSAIELKSMYHKLLRR